MRTPRRLGTFGLLLLCTAVALTISAASAISAGWAASAAGPLDGKSFTGETGEVGKTKGDPDGFVFQDGTFRSTACDQYGFKVAPYTATKNADGSFAWTATAESPKEGKMAWKGRVLGEAIDGTVSWSKAGQKTIDYWFKGMLKKAA